MFLYFGTDNFSVICDFDTFILHIIEPCVCKILSSTAGCPSVCLSVYLTVVYVPPNMNMRSPSKANIGENVACITFLGQKARSRGQRSKSRG